ncbi:MAG: MurR/RpiR family transcriptional regulator, partial [Alphaproteobacteria bacterium]
LDQPDEVAINSMRQVAARAGVQPATMVRLAKRLGCSGYDDLREAFRDRLRRQRSRYRSRARELQVRTGARGGDAGLARLAADMIYADCDNLTASLGSVGAEGLAAAATTLANARRLYLVGLRSLYPAAFYVHYACRMFRDDTVLIDGRGGTFTDDLRGVGREDAMLVFSFMPYSREAVQAASYAAERGARIVAVTDTTVSPLAELAEWVFPVTVESPALFQSVVPALAVAQVLVAQILAQGGKDALAAVAESEEQLNRFEAYWPDNLAPPRPRASRRDRRRNVG